MSFPADPELCAWVAERPETAEQALKLGRVLLESEPMSEILAALSSETPDQAVALASLRQEHNELVEALREQHARELASLRDRPIEALREYHTRELELVQDGGNDADIEALREQLNSQSECHARDLAALREYHASELERAQNGGSDADIEALREQLNNQSELHARELERAQNGGSDADIEALREQLNSQSKRHARELEALCEYHASELESAQENGDIALEMRNLRALVATSLAPAPAPASAVKIGVSGELSVLEIAKRVWPAAHFEDTSGKAAMSDIHVVIGGEDVAGAAIKRHRVVVECKNKATVTQDDVKKALRDVQEIAEKHADFAGYAFVSLRSAAIPGRGPLHFELVAPPQSLATCESASPRRIFVAWIGVDDAASEAERAICVSQCLTVVRSMAALAALERLQPHDLNVEMACEATSLIAGCMLQLDRLASQHKLVEAMRKSFDSANRALRELEASAAETFKSFEHYLEPMLRRGLLVCARCGKHYQVKSAFERHVEKCGI